VHAELSMQRHAANWASLRRSHMMSCAGRELLKMPQSLARRPRPVLWCITLALSVSNCMADCSHELIGIESPEQGGTGNYSNATKLLDGVPVMNHVGLNMTKMYWYENFNVTTMNQPESFKKLIISLEPCEGVVYLFVRKTRPCWPNPHSCCKPLPAALLKAGLSNIPTAPPCSPVLHNIKCDWTHYHSVIDGSQDGAPTFFEIPLSSTKHYISVFAPRELNVKNGITRARYRLTVLADPGAYPRPGLQGRLKAKHTGEMSVELQWEQATFMPIGISNLKDYRVYSSLLLATDNKMNQAVFLKPSKVMNTVCGLEHNAVNYGVPLTNGNCLHGVCKTTISGIVPKKRYMFNIVADSERNFNSSYAGIIVHTDWVETNKLGGESSDTVTGLVGAICGTVFGVVIIGYLWIVKLYN